MDKGFFLKKIKGVEKYSVKKELNLSLWLCTVTKGEEKMLSCFTVKFKRAEELDHYWEEIVAEIAINYVNEQTDTFSIWNCYCVFLCPKKVPKELKYKIENNKFAMRKIVIDSFPNLDDESKVIEALNKRILSFNVRASLVSQEKKLVRPPVTLSSLSINLLKEGLSIDRTNQSIDARNDWINNQLINLEKNENEN